MKRNVLIYGFVTGLIFSAHMVVKVGKLYSNPGYQAKVVIGYTAMVVMFSLVYFGIRNYRDKHLQGTISFGRAFKTGCLIALVGSSIYVLVWLGYYYLFVPDYPDVYTEHVLKNSSPSRLAARTQEMALFRERYKHPLFVVLITYYEVLPVGLVVALISSLILKTRPANNQKQSV